MNPIAFTIGSFEIRWYSLLILFGVFFGYSLMVREANRFHIKSEFIFNMLFWTIIFGILGARIYYVIFNLGFYLKNPVEIVKVWNGGLAIHGAIIAGALTILIYSKKYNLSVLKSYDMIVPSLIIAQAIGRWGNFFNSEAYGSIVEYSTLLKIKIIPQFIIDNMYINGSYHLPMFYFESIFCFIGFIILLIARRNTYIKKGSVFGIYLIWYGILRFVIEIFRSDSLMISNIKVAQLISILMIIGGIYLLIVNSKKPKLDDLYNKVEEGIYF